MYKVAVVGDRDSIYGFATAGLDIFPILDADGAINIIKKLVETSYAVIYMPESLFESLGLRLEEYENLVLPAIIPIPGIYGNTGTGLARVRKSVERAVGADILFGDSAEKDYRAKGEDNIE